MSERRAAWAWAVVSTLAGVAAVGCANAEQDDGAGSRAATATVPVKIEESDLYKLVGSTLYVQNASTGLNVIDVSDPALPVFKNRVRELAGNAGELYVRQTTAFVLLKEVVPACELPPELDSWAITSASQVVAVTDADSASAAEIAGELCLPGAIVTSRLVGEVLYVVTSLTGPGGAATWVFSVDTADPGAMAVVDHLGFDGEGYEVHVTDQALYVAQGRDGGARTRVRTVDIAPGDGTLRERGSFEVPGSVLSRFHLDEQAGTVRLVTFVSRSSGSNLYVVDMEDPDQPELAGSLTHLAPGEDLHATRFDGDVAYVVTYEPVVVQIDPLWVVSLA
ncbi:MAG TPA: beta-propeller domain-containing protein, partial [Polyangiaceae bacterium]|nr:beta-propeller domain-containing protein [Polyangiaceae bacterium]